MSERPGGPLFWITAVVGAVIVVIATMNLIDATPPGKVTNVGAYVLGSGVAHDAIWAPVLVLGGALTLLVPRRARQPVRIGLALTALLVLLTWPLVRRYGAQQRDPSVLPLDYAHNLVVTLIVLWLGVAVVVVVRTVRRKPTA